MELLTSLSLLSFLFLHLFLFSLLRLLYTRRGPSPVHRCHHFSLFLFGQFTKKLVKRTRDGGADWNEAGGGGKGGGGSGIEIQHCYKTIHWCQHSLW